MNIEDLKLELEKIELNENDILVIKVSKDVRFIEAAVNIRKSLSDFERHNGFKNDFLIMREGWGIEKLSEETLNELGYFKMEETEGPEVEFNAMGFTTSIPVGD